MTSPDLRPVAAPSDVPTVNVHLLWHEACKEWGEAVGGPHEYEIFAENLIAALAAQAAPAPLTDERAEFEQWASAMAFNIHRDDSEKYRDYHRATTRWAWQAWQARAALAAPGVPPQCWCATCRPITLDDMRMVLCPTCGNKRCPHATDHRNACTGSNEPGQPGSAYGVKGPDHA